MCKLIKGSHTRLVTCKVGLHRQYCPEDARTQVRSLTSSRWLNNSAAFLMAGLCSDPAARRMSKASEMQDSSALRRFSTLQLHAWKLHLLLALASTMTFQVHT